MSWLILLGKMLEERIGKRRFIALILILSAFSNTAQYLMAGPYFLGFSGVISGMVGFIWMRQRMSPWEGYPLAPGMILFLFLFILAMIVLQLITVTMEIFGIGNILMNIANTAHVAGAIMGVILARIPLFSRNPL